jgi:hypothetical protein
VPRYAIDLKVDNLLLYPDFEANFDLFEPLRSMQVGFDMRGENVKEIELRRAHNCRTRHGRCYDI